MQPDLYKIVPAPDELAPFVRRFMYANSAVPIDVTISPASTGFNYLGLIISGDVLAIADGHPQELTSKFHFAGQIQNQDISVRYTGRVRHLLAEFTPTGLHRLCHVRGAEISGRVVDVAAVNNKLGASLQHHFQDMAGQDMAGDEYGEEYPVEKFSNFLMGLVGNEAGETKFVEAAVTLIEAAGGRIQVSDICQQLEVSERHLSRLFSDIVGMGPKYFARVVQVNTVVGMLMSNNEASLAQLAQECGYFDQSHFIKAMQEFLKQGPREFLQGDNQMFHDFLGKSRDG